MKKITSAVLALIFAVSASACSTETTTQQPAETAAATTTTQATTTTTKATTTTQATTTTPATTTTTAATSPSYVTEASYTYDGISGTYTGECRDYLPEGFGTFDSNDLYYEGNWTNGDFNGDGCMVFYLPVDNENYIMAVTGNFVYGSFSEVMDYQLFDKSGTDKLDYGKMYNGESFVSEMQTETNSSYEESSGSSKSDKVIEGAAEGAKEGAVKGSIKGFVSGVKDTEGGLFKKIWGGIKGAVSGAVGGAAEGAVDGGVEGYFGG